MYRLCVHVQGCRSKATAKTELDAMLTHLHSNTICLFKLPERSAKLVHNQMLSSEDGKKIRYFMSHLLFILPCRLFLQSQSADSHSHSASCDFDRDLTSSMLFIKRSTTRLCWHLSAPLSISPDSKHMISLPNCHLPAFLFLPQQTVFLPLFLLCLNIIAEVIKRLKCQANVSFRDGAIHRNLGLREQVILQRFHRDSIDALKALWRLMGLTLIFTCTWLCPASVNEPIY